MGDRLAGKAALVTGAGSCAGASNGIGPCVAITSAVMPVSSRTSRTTACTGSSSGSMCPPGGSHIPFLRCQCSSVCSPSTTKPETVMWRSIGSQCIGRSTRGRHVPLEVHASRSANAR
jgi:hypothetical protein